MTGVGGRHGLSLVCVGRLEHVVLSDLRDRVKEIKVCKSPRIGLCCVFTAVGQLFS
jgi:hypothetical protein